ncbi:iron ABC transporter permease [Nevskia sp.]|uniref:FecCD family ABC transporter permease n=1 Tax=Nevskia sp. TaxID=1929292 RepID=UPI0025D7628C|nr:iron ABC transporter permease [Nevskia sp.]
MPKAVWLISLPLLVSLAGLGIGAPLLSPLDLLQGLAGEGPRWLQTLVLDIRLPRLLAGLVVGAALGTAGALLQALARNRLASPDLIGLNDGALLALTLSLLWSPAGLIAPWWCALFGSLATVLLVLLAAGGVGSQGYRVLVIGIGIGSLLKAGFDLALATLPVMHASGIHAFSVGSLSGRTPEVALTAAALLAILLLAAVPLQRTVALFGLPDDSIRSLGVALPRLRLTVLLLAAALAGLAVSVSGPIGFVAIAAPLLARRLIGNAAPLLFPAALVGAALVVAADTLGRLLATPAEVPAGVVTGLIGGPFLLWLLLRRTSR